MGRFTKWVGKKLEERREKNQLEQEEKEKIQEENRKHRFEIQDLLDKFTIKQLQEFCSSYIGTLPEDELEVDEDDDVIEVDEGDDFIEDYENDVDNDHKEEDDNDIDASEDENKIAADMTMSKDLNESELVCLSDDEESDNLRDPDEIIDSNRNLHPNTVEEILTSDEEYNDEISIVDAYNCSDTHNAVDDSNYYSFIDDDNGV